MRRHMVTVAAILIATLAVAHNLSAHIGAQFARREAESRS